MHSLAIKRLRSLGRASDFGPWLIRTITLAASSSALNPTWTWICRKC